MTFIIVILLTSSIPIYNKYILKAKFEEAKLMIHKIALAQERFKSENGIYYNSKNLNETNENVISEDLQVDLRISNNFIYKIINNEDFSSYKIIATLRYNHNIVCTNDTELNCKQENTKNTDDWVRKYNTSSDNHFLLFSYPLEISSGKYFDYDNIYIGN